MFLKKYANLRRFREYHARYGARTALLAVCMLTASSMGVVLSYFMSEQLVDISNVALAEMIRVTGVILAAALVLMCALWLFSTGQITVVVLLFDEPTSALDRENQRRFLGVIEELKRDRTVFVIAHKLGDLSAFDQVLEMENGRIVRREK